MSLGQQRSFGRELGRHFVHFCSPFLRLSPLLLLLGLTLHVLRRSVVGHRVGVRMLWSRRLCVWCVTLSTLSPSGSSCPGSAHAYALPPATQTQDLGPLEGRTAGQRRLFRAFYTSSRSRVGRSAAPRGRSETCPGCSGVLRICRTRADCTCWGCVLGRGGIVKGGDEL